MKKSFAIQSSCFRRTDSLHVAIIMDGNGRWAAARGLPRAAGHVAGAGTVRRISEGAREDGIGTLTLYAFSADNWGRPRAEVQALMNLFEEHLAGKVRECLHNGIRLRVIGRRDRLRPSLRVAIARAEEITAACTAMNLCLAIDYSSRDAITAAAGSPAADRAAFAERLGCEEGARHAVPDVDLLIRTGGEQRLSDFLLWECAYAELYFTATTWPDFGKEELRKAIRWFDGRERRFGRLPSVTGERHGRCGVRAPWFPRAFREPPPLDRSLATEHPSQGRILLVNPFYAKDPRASFGKHVLTPSLALTSIAASTPSGWEVVHWDENLLQGPPPAEPFPQVVGITVHLTFAERAYDIADWYRSRGAKVVLGGLHILSCPEEAAPHADAIVLGEGVRVWPQILRDIESGRLQPLYRGHYQAPYREEPAARRSILPQKAFLTTASIVATRGCHNRCRFCYLSTTNLHMPYQTRKVEQIVEEIREQHQPYAVFTDNNLGSRPGFLRDLCRALKPLDIIWSAAVSIDVSDDGGLVREMALSGCTGVFVGFESLTTANLTLSRKITPRAEEFASRVRIFHDQGIQVNGSFVLGFDHDGPEVFDATVGWIEEQRLECATFHILTPYPGTPLFRELESEGRILHRDWSRYDTSHVVFKPSRMSPEELEQGYARCYERLFSHRSIWRRRPEEVTALPAYLAMSYLYKRSNPLWHFLIRHNLTAAVWRPLIEVSRQRHLRYRCRLASKGVCTGSARSPLSAGV